MDRFVQTHGIRLHYLEHPGRAAVIVLLPGLTANAHVFDGLVQAGLSPRFHVLVLDLRGRGLSDAPAAGYTMAEHAADVVGLLDALGLRHVILGGHSFGGLLTCYLAARQPERVTRLIVMDAVIATAHPRTAELIRPSLARLGQSYPSWEAYLATMQQAPFFHRWWDPVIESYYRADVQIAPDGTVRSRSRPEVIAAALEGLLLEDWATLVASIQQPVLLLTAPEPYGPPGAPPIVTAEQASATVEVLAHCRHVQIPGNHMTMLFGGGARRIVEQIGAFVDEQAET